MKKNTFRKGQKVVCTHYKDQPIVVVEDIVDGSLTYNGVTEIWVKDDQDLMWWGPKEWFKRVGK